MSQIQPWRIERDEPLAETRVFTLRQRTSASQMVDGRRGEFVYLDAPDWVNVVAVTPDRRVVMVEQYRHGTDEITLEIPGGMVDPGEDLVAAAVRELAEETGYAGHCPQLIGCVDPNPAIQNNRCGTVWVRDAVVAGAPTPDGHEEIAVRTVGLDEVAALVEAGKIRHALVVAAFFHLLRKNV